MNRWHARLAELQIRTANVQNVQNVQTSSSPPISEHFEQTEQGPSARRSADIVPLPPPEPRLSEPCPARRGRVQETSGRIVHFCAECGRLAAFGYGVRLTAGRLGRWYCGQHRPQR
jgi:hypothetical protein